MDKSPFYYCISRIQAAPATRTSRPYRKRTANGVATPHLRFLIKNSLEIYLPSSALICCVTAFSFS